MAWYKTGTVAVTNASTTVTGTGTNFVSGAQVGDGFLGPNELLYEITAISSATSLTIAPAYGGATASSQSYAIAPTQGLVATLASDVTDLITDYQSVVDNAGAGKFGDGSAASPAIRFTNDQDTGFFRDTANEIAFATAGVKRGEFTSSGLDVIGQVRGDTGQFDGAVNIDGTLTSDGLTVETNNASIVFTGTTGNNFITAKQGLRIDIDSDNNQGATSFGVTRDGGLGNVLNANENGDVTLYASDGTTAKFFWDASSEFLGLGTSTPRTGLHLYGAGQTTSAISDAGSLGAFLRVSDTGAAGGAGGGVVFGTNASEADGFAGFAAIKGLLSNGNDRTIGALAFSTRASTTDTALTERMRLTSDGKLGIGTSLPAEKLSVEHSGDVAIEVKSTGTGDADASLIIDAADTGEAVLEFRQDGAAKASIEWFSAGSPDLNFRTVAGTNGVFDFQPNDTLAMRIDASGNLLVGTTSTSISNEGAVIFPSGVMTITNDGGRPLRLNRKTNDGDLIEFHKDGTTVGSIGVQDDDLWIGEGGVGLQFQNTGTDRVDPFDVANNTVRDNAIDLGGSSSRFNDLYLGGGVYLGGTGAANKLDDYEEGTWTPVYSDAGTGGNTAVANGGKRATYTKVGNLVTITASCSNLDTSGMTAGNDLFIQGVPFLCIALSGAPTTFWIGATRMGHVTYQGYVSAMISDGVQYVRFSDTRSNGAVDQIIVSNLLSGSADLHFTITYETSA